MAANKSLDGQKQDLNAVCHKYTLLQIGKNTIYSTLLYSTLFVTIYFDLFCLVDCFSFW